MTDHNSDISIHQDKKDFIPETNRSEKNLEAKIIPYETGRLETEEIK